MRVPTSMAWFTLQSWLMSHIKSTSAPMASRRTRTRSIDVVMIDLLRVGGITQWMKVAGMAEAFNLPVVSHLVPEIHAHLVAAVPNGLTVEYMPWTLRLYEERPALEGGRLVVPNKPGLGLAFDQAAIKRYQVG